MKKMKNSTKVLIGLGVLGAGFLAWKMLKKPKAAPAPAPAPGGTVNEALTNAVQNVQTVPKNVQPGALVGSTGAKNILDKIKQNVAAGTGIPKPEIKPINTTPSFSSVKPIQAIMPAKPIVRPGTQSILPIKPVVRPGSNKLGVTWN